MSTEYQRILMLLDALKGGERPISMQAYLERRAQRKGLENEKTVTLKRLAFIERELQEVDAEERRLAKIVLERDTVTKT